MISKRSLKLVKGKPVAVRRIASPKVIVVPKRSRMANARTLDAMVIANPKAIANRMVIASRKLDVKVNRRRAMASVVPKEIVHAMVSAVPRVIDRETVIADPTAIVRLKEKVAEARCLGSLNCSIRIKMAGSAATNSIG